MPSFCRPSGLRHFFSLLAAFFLINTVWADPPGRVGQLSLIEGEVWLKDSSNSERFIASLNWPITEQSALETGYEARAEIRIGSSTLRLAPQTRVYFDQLDDQSIRIRLETGSLALRFKNPEKARETLVLVPSGHIVFMDTGRYRIDIDAWANTQISSFSGNVRFDGQFSSFQIPSGRRFELSNEGSSRFTENFADSFSDWVTARDKADDRVVTSSYVSPEMTGYEVLAEHGIWEISTSYGPVWYPRYVQTGWAPYRYGRWISLHPWGRTWVDAAVWGFAVSHYGRWAYIGNRWGWIPGDYTPRPVWAPAIVAWAQGPHWSASVNFGSASVGWVPLGPQEVFIPYYQCPPNYWKRVNHPYVRETRVIEYVHANPSSQRYINTTVSGAISAGPSAKLIDHGSRPVYREVSNPVLVREAFHNNRVISAAPANRPPAAMMGPPRIQAGVVVENPPRPNRNASAWLTEQSAPRTRNEYVYPAQNMRRDRLINPVEELRKNAPSTRIPVRGGEDQRIKEGPENVQIPKFHTDTQNNFAHNRPSKVVIPNFDGPQHEAASQKQKPAVPLPEPRPNKKEHVVRPGMYP